MSIRKVVVLGHPVLRKVATPVPEKDVKSPKIQALIRDMIETMDDYDGRGLAAPQVAESLQVVVILWDFDSSKEPALFCLINPIIEPLTQERSTFWEGCLSIPGMRGMVSRPNKISVKGFDQKGEKVDLEVEGFAATVIQHECDHLAGKLYVDRMTDMRHFAFNREYQRYIAEPQEMAEGADD